MASNLGNNIEGLLTAIEKTAATPTASSNHNINNGPFEIDVNQLLENALKRKDSVASIMAAPPTLPVMQSLQQQQQEQPQQQQQQAAAFIGNNPFVSSVQPSSTTPVVASITRYIEEPTSLKPPAAAPIGNSNNSVASIQQSSTSPVVAAAAAAVTKPEEPVSTKAKTFEDKVDKLEGLLRKKWQYDDKEVASRKLEQVFKFFDTDNSGVIDYHEWIAAMIRLNFVGVQRQVDALFDRYDENGDGVLDYKEFASRVFGTGDKVLLDQAGKSIIERIKSKISETRTSVRSLTTLLRRMDTNKNNKLEREELVEGFAILGLDLVEEDVDKVMHYFDLDDDDHISLNEFIRGIRGSMNKERKAIVREAFRRLDKTGDGEVTVEDLVEAYDVSQHPSVVQGLLKPQEAVEELLSVYDGARSKDGKVTFQEFMEYYRDLSSSIEDDRAFELMVRNAWHISGGEGEAANSSNIRVLVIYTDGSQEVVEVKDDLGVSRKDMKKIEEKLVSQGIRNIAKVTFAA